MSVLENGIIAKLVWDGRDEVRIPEEMGKPAEGQMCGTSAERLTELGGRICYDSLGKGRSSPDYHAHILEVGHFSVCEHFHATVETALMVDPWTCVNRPGLWIRRSKGSTRLTFNPRVVLDWNYWSREIEVDDFVGRRGAVGDLLSWHAERLFPMIVKPREDGASYGDWSATVAPEHHEEKWLSFLLAGSRGFSHEQVRHRFRTGVSQRSTRYVDEDGSPWVDHPLVHAFMGSESVAVSVKEMVEGKIAHVKEHARLAYSDVAHELQKWLMAKGIDKLTARKQARGAARGYLGNALYTELIFSASVGQWKRMARLRCNDGADAEIRAVFTAALPELKRSRYGADFAAFELIQAKDGLGMCATERTGSV